MTKLFGPTTALADASFRLDPGLVHALLGPNGSGKTTAIDILTATRRADAGVASVFGHPVARGGASTSLVSLMPQAVDFPDYLTSREVLTLWLAHYPDALKVPDAITTFELNDIADRQTGGLSGGQAKRLALACAVASSTPLIVLDEPSASLDVYGQRFVTATIQRLRDSGTTVLLASHDMHEVERLADRILCLDSGRVLGQWSADDFRALAGYRSLFFRSTLPEHRVRLLCESAGMEAQRDVTVPGRWRIDTPRSDDAARRLLECAVNPGLTIREAGIGDVFERIVAMSGERER
ncbi:ABC transporter ATP-binding protein [Planctomonas psychrotolerans]|uniref:ABC transporter ATP-binding protein n=1 Tax=Planctomonas psychrotolerans TaxID=2528712 RepID=UPI001D0D2839|nr:ABC transporter ATP-binding protein [Planctomonas psychrotolerans]